MTNRTTTNRFNTVSFGGISHITEGHKAVFMAMTAGAPNFCLTSVYVNGRPGVAIVLLDRESKDTITMAPCFVSVTEGMILCAMDGYEWRI
jgi:hypothetical protein